MSDIAVLDIEQLLKNGRSAHLDWLSTETAPETMAETFVAMANSRYGGTVLHGVTGTDTPTVNDIDEPGNQLDSILEALLMISPALIVPMPTVLHHNDKKLIMTYIPPGMPHVYAIKGRYYVREGLENTPLPPQKLRQLLMLRGEINFESQPAYGATRDDIDWKKAQDYATRMGAADVNTLLLKRGCLTRQHSELMPTNAGILLFGKDVQSMLRGSEITAVRFAGEAMGDTFSRQDIGGTLPDQIRRAETFLRDHIRKQVALTDTMARDERFEYPLEAARELLVNAVAHRDYSVRGDGIRLYLFQNRMEITSPGLLSGPVTIDNIKDERFSRNPAIVQVLADMGFIERLGYGVDRVIELMIQQEMRAPEFTETGGGFRVTLYNSNEPIPASQDQNTKPKTPAEVTQAILNATEKEKSAEDILAQYRHIPLNPRQETALKYLHEDDNTRITNSELGRLHPDVHAETIRRDLSDLVTKGLLEKMGEKRGSYYILKETQE